MKRPAIFDWFIRKAVQFLGRDNAAINPPENGTPTLRPKIKRKICFGPIRHTKKCFGNCGQRAPW